MSDDETLNRALSLAVLCVDGGTLAWAPGERELTMARALIYLDAQRRESPSAELGTTPECQQTINHMSRQAELLDEQGHDVSAGVMRAAMKAPGARGDLPEERMKNGEGCSPTPKHAEPSQRIVRGLEWIYRMARSDYEVASGEKGTGAFAGTTEKEVDAALDWLHQLVTTMRKP